MKNIIEKLKNMGGNENEGKRWKNWSMKEKKELLEIYLVICKNEKHIFDLVYMYHGTDGWEDIFRDYDERMFYDKMTGVEMAIDGINEAMMIVK